MSKEVLMIAPTFLPVMGGSETHINDLINNLSGRQIPDKPYLAGVAKGTIKLATCLSGNT